VKISHFINEALFNKDSGYYRTKNPIGKNSDFITAPEISQVFGELIAAYILQISSTKKSKISLVEMGAGKGTLLRDILVLIKKLSEKKNPQAVDFLERADFHIIEINEVLQKIQKENLSEFKIAWHENFADFFKQANEKSPREIFFLSNELFDCFPIDQFVKTDIGWCERHIDCDKFITANFNPQIHQFVESLLGSQASQSAPFGGIFEYSEAAINFMKQLCEALKALGGIAINFDYGYLKTEFANTLQAVKNHQKVNALENVGECDITALVDFSALDKIAKNSGLNSSLISQAHFLTSLGIEERRKNLIATNPEKSSEINSAIDRLIASDQMGELFKCHILWK
jgi:NADH dehydrogenase [ubiquinone] 1 alpha subcomplex assembly factor 7